MKMVTTRWRPDTCGCILNYEWDRDLAIDQRTHTLKSIEQKCAAHSGKDDAKCYTDVKDENTRKNLTVAHLLENYDVLRKSVKNDDGEHQHYEFKDTVTLDWSFDGSRKLNVSVNKLTTGEKSTVQTNLDTEFGADKVSIS